MKKTFLHRPQINDLVLKVLSESVEGIDDFVGEIVKRHPDFKEHADKLEEAIEKSGCKKIEFSGFNFPAWGAALHSGVLINNQVLYQPLPLLLFVIFHEIAHQYQYQKYGAEKMYEYLEDEISDEDAAKFLYGVEIVADEFGSRKLREFQNKGYVESGFVPPSVYKNMSPSSITKMVQNFKKQIKDNLGDREMNVENLGEILYNWIKDKNIKPNTKPSFVNRFLGNF